MVKPQTSKAPLCFPELRYRSISCQTRQSSKQTNLWASKTITTQCRPSSNSSLRCSKMISKHANRPRHSTCRRAVSFLRKTTGRLTLQRQSLRGCSTTRISNPKVSAPAASMGTPICRCSTATAILCRHQMIISSQAATTLRLRRTLSCTALTISIARLAWCVP